VSEGGSLQIKGNCNVIGSECVKLRKKHVQKAVDRLSKKSGGGGKRAYSVKLTVEDAVSVNCEKLWHM
jgi:hypothetical protein